MWRFDRALVALLAGCLAVACQDDPLIALGEGGGGGHGGAGGAGGAPAAEAVGLQDEEILHVAVVATEGAIAITESVLDRLGRPDVLALAEGFLEDHLATKKRIEALFEELELEPVESQLSFDLSSAVARSVSVLAMSSDDIVDAVYLEQQIATHRHALQLVEYHLVPATGDGRVDAFLRSWRQEILAHIAEAEAVQRGGGPVEG